MVPVASGLCLGFRQLWKYPGFSAIALVALALGTGASTAIFSVVDAVLLKPLPFRDPGRLVVIWESKIAEGKTRMPVVAASFLEWRRQSTTFEAIAAVSDLAVSLTAGPDVRIEAQELKAERVSSSLFRLLGVQAAVGRAFGEEEDRPGNANVVLLSYRLWQTRFGADRSIPGKAIRIQDRSYTVVGVLPPDFWIVERGVDLWIPAALNTTPQALEARNLTVVGRLSRGVSIAQARAELDGIGARLELANPSRHKGWRPSVFPLRKELVAASSSASPEGVERTLLVLLGAVGALQLMACVNVANLLLARAVTRRKEFAIRTALGAGRANILTQLVSESVALALAGGAAGLALARVLIAIAIRLGPSDVPRLAGARLDARIFAFAFGLSMLTGLLFGLVPALAASRTSSAVALNEGGRGGTMGRRSRAARGVLVANEVALAVLLLIAAGLLFRSFLRLRTESPGFDPAQVLTVRVPMSRARAGTLEQRAATVQQLLDRLTALPGVRAVAAINTLPLTGLGVGDMFTMEGRPDPADQGRVCLVRSVTPSYFHVMGVPFRGGRDFDVADNVRTSQTVIVNEALARRFQPGAALGGRLKLTYVGGAQIVGIVGDVKSDRLGAEDWPTVYYPYARMPNAAVSFVIRTAVRPASLAAAVEREIHRLDPDLPASDLRPMQSVVDEALSPARFNVYLLCGFAAIAFGLVAVGIYGVISYDVTRRTSEIGIRMALGAQPGAIVKLIVGYGGLLAAYGLAAGLGLAAASTRLMSSMLYGISATDPYTFAAVFVLLGGVAILASWLPARRAMRLDPVTALRLE